MRGRASATPPLYQLILSIPIVEGGTGKTAFSPVRAHIFTSVECLGLYFNRTHNTQNLLLKKQRTRDICTANAKTTHNPRHAAIARPCDIRNKKRLPGIPTTCICHPPSCPGFLLPCPGCSQLLLIRFPLGKLPLGSPPGRGFWCGGAPPPAAPRPWPTCSPDAQFCAFERTTCWVK